MTSTPHPLEPAPERNAPSRSILSNPLVVEPPLWEIAAAALTSLALVLLTRPPTARWGPMESDEFDFLGWLRADRVLPPQHTLYLGLGRWLGGVVQDPYLALLTLGMLTSAAALTATWWWLRALVAPRTAALTTLTLACAPAFWIYGAMAGNCAAIPAVGATLLGIAIRGRRAPATSHPYAAAAILALGAGYRLDSGLFWTGVLVWILAQARRPHAIAAGSLFVALNAAWFVPMIVEAGGWSSYRSANRDFARHMMETTSIWSQGLVDGPLRCAVKLGIGLAFSIGLGLAMLPRGLRRISGDRAFAALLALSVAPALAFHLLIHFGTIGYALHYAPAALAALALGAEAVPRSSGQRQGWSWADWRLSGVAAAFALWFWLYPSPPNAEGWRKDFELTVGRHSRMGLQSPLIRSRASAWSLSRAGQGD